MHKDGSGLTDSIAGAVDVDRRTVNRAMAWSVPVVMAAVAAPAATGSRFAQIGTPTVAAVKTGGPKGKVEFTLTFSNTGTLQGSVEVLTVSAPSPAVGAYQSGLPQTLVIGPSSSTSTAPIIWDYKGDTPKATTYTFTYKVDDGAVSSVTFKI